MFHKILKYLLAIISSILLIKFLWWAGIKTIIGFCVGVVIGALVTFYIAYEKNQRIKLLIDLIGDKVK